MNSRVRVFAILATAMVVINALWGPTVLALAYMAPGIFQTLIRTRVETVDGLEIAVRFLTMAAFAWWIYAAGRNLAAADVEGLEYSPGARVWWFLVPVANWIKPFQAMREMWNASRGNWPYDENNTLISIWWALWIAGAVFAMFNRLVTHGNTPPIRLLEIGYALQLLLAPAGIRLIWGITNAQGAERRGELREVFA